MGSTMKTVADKFDAYVFPLTKKEKEIMDFAKAGKAKRQEVEQEREAKRDEEPEFIADAEKEKTNASKYLRQKNRVEAINAL